MIKTTFKLNKKNNIGNLTLKGNLTIENIEDVKNSILTALNKIGTILINHSEADQFDFSYLQLLVSFIKTAAIQNQKIFIAHCDSENFSSLMSESGFNNLTIFTNCFNVK